MQPMDERRRHVAETGVRCQPSHRCGDQAAVRWDRVASGSFRVCSSTNADHFAVPCEPRELRIRVPAPDQLTRQLDFSACHDGYRIRSRQRSHAAKSSSVDNASLADPVDASAMRALAHLPCASHTHDDVRCARMCANCSCRAKWRQTGGTQWRRSEKWRFLVVAAANRATSWARTSCGSMTASTTSSLARCRMSMSRS
jgi:hypothetical protein